jgi:aspartyl-tRNA(Asn)/glutamyl-tRNA(Gln) amidotransferase subunit C
MNSDTVITQDELRHIAKLSRLIIDPEKEDELANQLSQTAAYIDVLKELNTENVLPTAQVNNKKNVLREDNIKASLSQEEALSQAPDTCDGYFKTQATIIKK